MVAKQKRKKKISLSQEEYKQLRAEMMQRFEYSRNLLLFLITSTIALLSFLALSSIALSSNELSTLLFVTVGLSLTSFISGSYVTLYKRIYRAGSYLAVFHELDSNDLRWHWLSRFGYDEWIKKKTDWGKGDPRTGTIFLVFLIINWIGPSLILNETMIFLPTSLEGLGIFLFALILSCYIMLKFYDLITIRKEMLRTMDNWMAIRKEMEKDSSWFVKRAEEQIEEIRKKLRK